MKRMFFCLMMLLCAWMMLMYAVASAQETTISTTCATLQDCLELFSQECPVGYTCTPTEPQGQEIKLLQIEYTAMDAKPEIYRAKVFDSAVDLKYLRYELVVSILASDNPNDAKGWRNFLEGTSAPRKKAWNRGRVPLYIQFGPRGEIVVKSGNGKVGDADNWAGEKKRILGWIPVDGGEVTLEFHVGSRVQGTVSVEGFDPIEFDFATETPLDGTKEVGGLLGNSIPKNPDPDAHDQVHWAGIKSRLVVWGVVLR